MTTRQQTLQLGARTTEFINHLDETNPAEAALAAVLRNLIHGSNNLDTIETALHAYARTKLQAQQTIRAEEEAARRRELELTVYTIPCSDCQVTGGERCITAAGRPRRLDQPHAVRRTAYERHAEGKG